MEQPPKKNLTKRQLERYQDSLYELDSSPTEIPTDEGATRKKRRKIDYEDVPDALPREESIGQKLTRFGKEYGPLIGIILPIIGACVYVVSIDFELDNLSRDVTVNTSSIADNHEDLDSVDATLDSVLRDQAVIQKDIEFINKKLDDNEAVLKDITNRLPEK